LGAFFNLLGLKHPTKMFARVHGLLKFEATLVPLMYPVDASMKMSIPLYVPVVNVFERFVIVLCSCSCFCHMFCKTEINKNIEPSPFKW
jgi:hypothetical protein